MEVYPTSIATPVPLSIDYSHLQKSPRPGESGLAPHDWRTLGFCSWAEKSEGAKSRERGFLSVCGYGWIVAAAKFFEHSPPPQILCPSVSWVVESILGYSCVLCSATTQGTEPIFGLRQQIPPSLLHQPLV